MKYLLILAALIFNRCPGSDGGNVTRTPSPPTPPTPPTVVEPREDAIIIEGTGHCNYGWTYQNIKNNSADKFLTVTVKESRQLDSRNPSFETKVFTKLAPKEERGLGCKGCGNTTTGRLCADFNIEAAVYENP